MPARTLTGNNPRREQRVQSLMLDRLVLRYRGRIMVEIRRAMRAAASNISRGDVLPVDSAMSEHRRRMSVIMQRLWQESGHEMAEHIDTTVKSRQAYQTKQTIEESVDNPGITPTEIADQVMADWIRTEGGAKITQITATTQNNIQSILSAGIQDGLSEREIAKQIRLVAPGISGSRADTISRTETHGAANISAQATAKASGVQLKREWASAEDERTRQAHDDADGQQVDMDQAFRVGGEDLMYPGDPRGSASNVINCRCAVVFVIV